MNSRKFSDFAKYGAGRTFFDNEYYRIARLSKNYLLTYFLSQRNGKLFQDVKTYCTFIGHMKSGGSMLGALLDAHPNAVFSDEANILEHVQFGFNKNQLFQIVLRNAKAEALKGRVTARRLGGYSWAVPGQWQGNHGIIQVLGDTTTGVSTRSLSLKSDLMQKLHKVMTGIQVKFIHVIRNPFDPMAASMVRGKRSFESALENYFAACGLLMDLRKRIDPGNLLAVRYEDFVETPHESLRAVCGFLGLGVTDDYLNACGQVINSSDKSRALVEWKPEWVSIIHNRIDQYDFLKGYTFES